MGRERWGLPPKDPNRFTGHAPFIDTLFQSGVDETGVRGDVLIGSPPGFADEPNPVFDGIDALPPAALEAVAEKLAANLPDRQQLEALLADIRSGPDNDVYSEEAEPDGPGAPEGAAMASRRKNPPVKPGQV